MLHFSSSWRRKKKVSRTSTCITTPVANCSFRMRLLTHLLYLYLSTFKRNLLSVYLICSQASSVVFLLVSPVNARMFSTQFFQHLGKLFVHKCNPDSLFPPDDPPWCRSGKTKLQYEKVPRGFPQVIQCFPGASAGIVVRISLGAELPPWGHGQLAQIRVAFSLFCFTLWANPAQDLPIICVSSTPQLQLRSWPPKAVRFYWQTPYSSFISTPFLLISTTVTSQTSTFAHSDTYPDILSEVF